MPSLLDKATAFLREAIRASSGLMLLATFVSVFSSILLLISALQLHQAVQSASPDLHASVGQVRLDVIFLNDRDRIAQENARLLGGLRAKHDGNITSMQQARVAMYRAARRTETTTEVLAEFYPEFEAIKPASDWLEKPMDALFEYTTAIGQTAVKSGIKRQEVSDLLHKIAAATAMPLKQYGEAWAVYEEVKGRDDLVSERIKELEKGLTPLSGALADDSYRNVVEDFRAYEHIFGNSVYQIVLIPKSMLVLLLAISMGMLGSLIYVARSVVLEDAVVGGHEIFFRIGLGAAVALALFFFSSAGVLAMSQDASDKSQIDMSPYLISFLGIMGGYLSDHVTTWMQEVGKKAFKLESSEPDRWAIRLDDRIREQGLTSEDIAEIIDGDASEIEAWAHGDRPVPPLSQKALALCLRLNVSQLFTDLAPHTARITPPPSAESPAQTA